MLLLAIAAVYWPVVGYPFTLFDDPDYVWLNPHVVAGLSWPGTIWAFTTLNFGNWHPLTWLSYMLDIRLFGMHAGVCHTVNVLFHAANTALLFWALKRMTGAVWRSALVAALFGLHPLHVESVAWIAERKDVLSTFFFMLTLLAYVRYVEKSRVQGPRSKVFYGLALLWFALGLMSKPMLVTLPFVLLLLDYWPLKRILQLSSFKHLLLEKLPFFALSIVSCVITYLAQAAGGAVKGISVVPFGLRIENALVSYLAYLEKMVWPASLAVFYPYSWLEPASVATAAFLLLVISGLVIFYLRRRPYLAVGWLWFLGTLVPVIGLVQIGAQALADRYTYVPLIGIFIAIAWGLGELAGNSPMRRATLTIVSVAAVAMCMRCSAVQVRFWQNTETLARHALAVTANNDNMQVLLGTALLEEGKFAEGASHLSEAVKLNPGNFRAQSNLALALADEGKIVEAIKTYRVAIGMYPREAKPHYMLGNLLSRQGNFAEAIAEYQTTLRIEPNNPLALNDFAWLLATAPEARFRNGAEAVKLAERACRVTGYQMPLFVGTLAAAYAEAGRFDDAEKAAEQAIALATAEGKPALADKNRELLELYKARKAYHEPPER